MSKIISLKAENIKRLQAVEIKPSGHVVVIGGNNGQGKSSVLDSIAYALGGKNELPGEPVRRGESKGSVVVELDDLVVRRTFTKAGGTALTVESKEGLKHPSPQSILDKLTGKLTFDPLAFLRLDEKRQAEILRELVGLDFSSLDAERQELYDRRTLVNRDAKGAEARIAAMPFYAGATDGGGLPEVDAVLNAPPPEADTAAIDAEIEQGVGRNAEVGVLLEKARVLREKANDKFTRKEELVAEVKRLEASLKKAQQDLYAAQDEYKDAVDESVKMESLSVGDSVDVESLRAKRRSIVAAHNERVAREREELTARRNAILENTRKAEANQAREKAVAENRQTLAESERLTAAIDKIDAEKQRLLAAAKFPVAGLSFDAARVTFNGLPFGQASSAEQLRLSVAISAALNPKLRVMMVRDGSLLDEASLAELSRLAAEHDLQVWLERVGVDEHVSVVIEDGHIKEAA